MNYMNSMKVIRLQHNSKFCVAVGSVYMRGEKTNPLVSCGCVGIGMSVCEAQKVEGVTNLAGNYINMSSSL